MFSFFKILLVLDLYVLTSDSFTKALPIPHKADVAIVKTVIAAKAAKDEGNATEDWVSLKGFTQGNTMDVPWLGLAQQDLERTLEATSKRNRGPAKNVIIFVGDGMGFSTLTPARIYQAQQRRLHGNDALLAWDKFIETGLLMTYATDYNVPDSAAAASALFCGERSEMGTICVNQKVHMGNCTQQKDGNELVPLLQRATEQGKWAGLAVTSRVTHATPAAAYANAANREWECDADVPEEDRDSCRDIALQLVNADLRVVLGGGRQVFYPEGTPDAEFPKRRGAQGCRLDGRNLTEEWMEKRQKLGAAHYVVDSAGFDNADPEKTDYLLGLFNPSHMSFETDRLVKWHEPWGQPSLAEMTEKAVRILSRSPDGFVLLVEGSRIDHAHHGNLAHKALNDTLAMSDAVKVARELTSADDTLIIVTADHSHSFSFNGYQSIDNDILGLADDGRDENGDFIPAMMNDGLPYLTLSYTNGPGYLYHRSKIVTGPREDRRNLNEDAAIGVIGGTNYPHDSGLGRDDETHSGEDVPVFADGPGSFLFRGLHEQPYVAHAVQYAACIGHFTNAGLCAET